MTCPLCSGRDVWIERRTPPKRGGREIGYRCRACLHYWIVVVAA